MNRLLAVIKDNPLVCLSIVTGAVVTTLGATHAFDFTATQTTGGAGIAVAGIFELCCEIMSKKSNKTK